MSGVVDTTRSSDIGPFFKPSGIIPSTCSTPCEREEAQDDREA